MHGFHVLLIDPHPIVNYGLAAALADAFHDINTTGARTLADAAKHFDTRSADLVISEFTIHGESILPLIQSAAASARPSRFLIYSAFDESQAGVPAIRAGASGFVGKAAPIPTLIDAVQALRAGRSFISDSLARALTGRGSIDDPLPSAPGVLSRRELEIFSLLGQGLTVSQIAAKLDLAVKTVASHREHIKTKLKLQTAPQVTAAAVRWIDSTTTSI